MPGKKKDPNKTYEGWGGSRTHPPGSGGRKPKPVKSRLVAVGLTDEEYEQVKIKMPDTRERGLAMLEAVKEAGDEKDTK